MLVFASRTSLLPDSRHLILPSPGRVLDSASLALVVSFFLMLLGLLGLAFSLFRIAFGMLLLVFQDRVSAFQLIVE